MYRKLFLNELIYRVSERNPFIYNGKGWFSWSSPRVEFAYDNSLEEQFLRLLTKKHFIRESQEDVLCALRNRPNVVEGIFFTTQAMYVDTTRNGINKRFKVRYANIKKMEYISNVSGLVITTYGDKSYRLKMKMWNIRSIRIFLEFAARRMCFDVADKKIVDSLKLECCEGHPIEDVFVTILRARVEDAKRAAANIAELDAQEKAIDSTAGQFTAITEPPGQTNIDIPIQSKYYSSGKKCVRECFSDNGKGFFRYMNQDGTPMPIEVPSDKYDAAIQAMKAKIKQGKVPNVTNPEEAGRIIRKGGFTYEQAKYVAQSGTVESLTFDSVHGAIVTTNAMLITTILGFSLAVWNGDDIKEAATKATFMGLKVGGSIWVTSLLTTTIVKNGMDMAFISGYEALASFLGPEASAVLVNSLRHSSNVYGVAAMQSASRLLRGNIISGTISVLLLSTADIVHIFEGRISGAQLFKNIFTTTAGVASGFGGWVAGAAAGGSIGSVVPVVGTAVGTVVGAILGGMAGANLGSVISREALNTFIEDDANAMVRIIEERMVVLAHDYLLTRDEVENIADNLRADLTKEILQIMFACKNQQQYADGLLQYYIDIERQRRVKIKLPDQAIMNEAMIEVLQTLAKTQPAFLADNFSVNSTQ
jgi:hypothetical protein